MWENVVLESTSKESYVEAVQFWYMCVGTSQTLLTMLKVPN